MQILVLGAGALMAQPAIQHLVSLDQVSRLVLADLDSSRLPKVTASNQTNIEYLAIDVTQADALLAAMEDIDLVVNTTGPYYLLAPLIVKTAIDARCHYVDICDDWEPTIELLGLDEHAKANNVLVLLGAGASPGITNLLARQAADQLDTVQRIYTGWSIASDSETAVKEVREVAKAKQTPAALVHWMQQISGEIQIWADGAQRTERPLQRYDLQYPGLGQLVGWSLGHPEAITLPQYYPSLKESVNLMFDGGGFIGLLRCLAWSMNNKLVSARSSAKVIRGLAKAINSFMDEEHQVLSVGETNASRPLLFALAEGVHQGQASSIAISLQPRSGLGMAQLTGQPLALFCEWILLEKISRVGVVAPEALNLDRVFFARLAQRLGGTLDGAEPIFKQTATQISHPFFKPSTYS